ASPCAYGAIRLAATSSVWHPAVETSASLPVNRFVLLCRPLTSERSRHALPALEEESTQDHIAHQPTFTRIHMRSRSLNLRQSNRFQQGICFIVVGGKTRRIC